MHWLTANWHTLLPTPWLETSLAMTAALCGGWIGNERQHREKPAGLRTMTLVCLGSAVFTMIGVAFAGTNGDSGRVAAQVVTGIGFLGGGVIMRGAGGVLGTTTAATIWVTAAIGMVVGAGYVGAGLGLAGMVLGVLTGIGKWERSHQGGGRMEDLGIVFDPQHGKALIKIEKVLDDFGIALRRENLALQPDGRMRLQVSWRLPGHRHIEFLSQLAALPEVVKIER